MEDSFDLLWNSIDNFEVSEGKQAECVYAQRFSQWAQELVLRVTQTPDTVGVNQAKVQLQDKYFEWRRYVPKSHRQRLGSGGHQCIFQVYVATYDQLRLLELSLTPPMLFIPPPPPKRQPGGIYLVDVDEVEGEL